MTSLQYSAQTENNAAPPLIAARERLDLIEISVCLSVTSGIRNTLRTTLAILRCVYFSTLSRVSCMRASVSNWLLHDCSSLDPPQLVTRIVKCGL